MTHSGTPCRPWVARPLIITRAPKSTCIRESRNHCRHEYLFKLLYVRIQIKLEFVVWTNLCNEETLCTSLEIKSSGRNLSVSFKRNFFTPNILVGLGKNIIITKFLSITKIPLLCIHRLVSKPRCFYYISKVAISMIYDKQRRFLTWSHWFKSAKIATHAPSLPPSSTVCSRARWAEPKLEEAVTEALGIWPLCIPRGA